VTTVPQPNMAPTTAPGRSETVPRVVALGFGALCVSYMLNVMDRQIFYPLLPDFSAEFGFTLEQGGALANGFTLGLAIAGLFMLTYYVGAALSGLLFARLVGELGWNGAGLRQLTVLCCPFLGVAAVALVNTSQILVPHRAAKV